MVSSVVGVIFFFKQKTAYEMLRSLVGSEMCIRDRPYVVAQAADLAGIDGPATLLSKARGGSIVFDEVADYDADTQARAVRMLDMLGDKAPRVMATRQTDLAVRM